MAQRRRLHVHVNVRALLFKPGIITCVCGRFWLLFKGRTNLFFKIGVSLGRRSLMGGVIFVIPMTLTIAFSPARILPRTSGYSSPRYSYKTTPRWPRSFSYEQGEKERERERERESDVCVCVQKEVTIGQDINLHTKHIDGIGTRVCLYIVIE